MLVAAGRRPNSEDLDPARAGIAVDARGALWVDGALRTTNPRVWAAGDVTGHPQLVYLAAREGALAASNALLGRAETLDLRALPRVIFTSPTAAAAGLTAAQAEEQGIPCDSRVLPMSAVPRAIVNRDTRGFVLTGRDVPQESWTDGLPPESLATSIPGVFAVGDTRAGSTKRVAAAISACAA